MPEKSGFPLARRGAGAERSAVPSALRGIPVVLLSHCAPSDVLRPIAANAAAIRIMIHPSPRAYTGHRARFGPASVGVDWSLLKKKRRYRAAPLNHAKEERI